MIKILENNSEILKYLNSLTLLCVEDEPTILFIYKAIFENIVGEIIFAENGQEGLEKFRDNEIDIIVTDYNMPILNGLDMCEQIREFDKEIPIVLVTSIDETDVIIRALHLQVNNFVKKPILSEPLVKVIVQVAKTLIADDYIKEKNKKKIKALETKEKYSVYQEDLAFKKELNILKNDFYYHMLNYDENTIFLIDFLYKPLDILSGDAYSSRKISKDKTLYLIVDGMGKGLSASLSAMIITSYINHIIDKMLEDNSFHLHHLISQSLEYMSKILLDEEALSIDYIVIDYSKSIMEYAKFAMPVALMQTNDGEMIRLQSNNPPMNKYQKEFQVSSYDIKQIVKFLFYSDGVVENQISDKSSLYADFIEEDFKNSLSKREFTNKLYSKISEQSDDMTLVFINKLHLQEDTFIESKKFGTSLEEVDNANEWYANTISKISSSEENLYYTGLVFNELFMNAYEHGNLGIDIIKKHQLMEEGVYFDALLEEEKTCSKTIDVKIDKIQNATSTYIITQISDEGKGFDTQLLSKIFRHSDDLNGRGVFVSRKNSMGIYYNGEGNTVLYLNKI